MVGREGSGIRVQRRSGPSSRAVEATSGVGDGTVVRKAEWLGGTSGPNSLWYRQWQARKVVKVRGVIAQSGLLKRIARNREAHHARAHAKTRIPPFLGLGGSGRFLITDAPHGSRIGGRYGP